MLGRIVRVSVIVDNTERGNEVFHRILVNYLISCILKVVKRSSLLLEGDSIGIEGSLTYLSVVEYDEVSILGNCNRTILGLEEEGVVALCVLERLVLYGHLGYECEAYPRIINVLGGLADLEGNGIKVGALKVDYCGTNVLVIVVVNDLVTVGKTVADSTGNGDLALCGVGKLGSTCSGSSLCSLVTVAECNIGALVALAVVVSVYVEVASVVECYTASCAVASEVIVLICVNVRADSPPPMIANLPRRSALSGA